MRILYHWIIFFRDCWNGMGNLQGSIHVVPHVEIKLSFLSAEANIPDICAHSLCLDFSFKCVKGQGRYVYSRSYIIVCALWKTWFCSGALLLNAERGRGYGASDKVSFLRQLPYSLSLSGFFLKCASPSGYFYCLSSWLIFNGCQHLLLSWSGKLSNLTLHMYYCSLMIMVIILIVASDLTK